MVSITIRKLDEGTKSRLRVRAAHRNRSMEDEARTILRLALAEETTVPGNLAQAIARRFQNEGDGVDTRHASPPIHSRSRTPFVPTRLDLPRAGL